MRAGKCNSAHVPCCQLVVFPQLGPALTLRHKRLFGFVDELAKFPISHVVSQVPPLETRPALGSWPKARCGGLRCGKRDAGVDGLWQSFGLQEERALRV